MDSTVTLIRLLFFLIGCACLAVIVLVAMALAVRHAPSLRGSPWRRRYTIAFVLGGIIGALAGVAVTFVCMAVTWGLPPPWNVLVFPLGALVGGLVVGLLFMLPVALVHGVAGWGSQATNPASGTAPEIQDVISKS